MPSTGAAALGRRAHIRYSYSGYLTEDSVPNHVLEATLPITRPQPAVTFQRWLPQLLAIVLAGLGLVLAVGQWRLALDAPAVVESTPGQLGLWIAGQTERDDAEALLVKWTRPTVPGGILDDPTALARARMGLGLLGLIPAVLSAATLYTLWRHPARARSVAFWLLLSYLLLLLNVPPLERQSFYLMVLAGLALSLVLLFYAPGRVSPVLGSLVVVCALLFGWELYKAMGDVTGNWLPLTDFPWKLPHWQDTAAELLQPARRNGPFLLVRILAEAALVTWQEAFIGFAAGSLLGFALGVLFAHSPLLERGLLPYAVASQTVPIIAIAPMIVSFLGQGWLPVAVISAYLTFFPVTVNTLRGLLSPEPLKLELMRSYAAGRSTILWKLRVPSALPYIFTALKVSATSSVVGAIVGELPSSRSDGLAAAILRASGNYAAEPEKLWATIIMASLVGILFFTAVTLVERFVLRGFVRT
jgi:NitT/TauT family transport system permease protein